MDGHPTGTGQPRPADRTPPIGRLATHTPGASLASTASATSSHAGNLLFDLGEIDDYVEAGRVDPGS